MFDFEKSANSIGKTQDQIHVENVFRKFGEKTGSYVLEIEERVKAKNRKPVFKHISEFFEFWCDERGASLNVLTDAGEYYLVIWTCNGHDMSIYYVPKSEIDLPECAFRNIQLYQNLGGGSMILTPIVKNGAKKYALYVQDKKPSDQVEEFVKRFPPSKRPKQNQRQWLPKTMTNAHTTRSIGNSLRRQSNDPPPEKIRGSLTKNGDKND